MSHALRHAPEEYGLVLGAEGWVTIDALLDGLRRQGDEWAELSRDDVAAMMAKASKQRFEWQDERIRARYGHSVDARIERSPGRPPDILYHGTTPEVLPEVSRRGLRPMRRQSVHLSEDPEAARMVGLRKGRDPVVLHVLAGRAHDDGLRFEPAGEGVWLAPGVSPEYVDIAEPQRNREMG